MSGIAAETRTSIAVGRCQGRTISPAKGTVTGTVTNTAKAIITATTAPRRLAAPTEHSDMHTEDGRAVLMLQRDQEAMNWWYPQFRLLIPMIGPTHWRGRIKPFKTRLSNYEIVVVYRAHIHAMPQVWVVEPEISRRTHFFHPHLHAEGSICSFFPPDRTYTPERDDISLLIDLVSDWLRRHIYFEENGRWPGPEAPHHPGDVLRALSRKPDAPCICGRKIPFRLCCKRRYEILAKTAPGPSKPSAQELEERRRIQNALNIATRTVGSVAFAAIRPDLGPPAWMLRRNSFAPDPTRSGSRQERLNREGADVGAALHSPYYGPSDLPLRVDVAPAGFGAAAP